MFTPVLLCVNAKVVVPIVVVAAVALIALVVYLLCRKQKSDPSPRLTDSELIERTAKAVDVLIEIALRDDDKIKLRALKEKLKYLVPSESDIVYEADEYIADEIKKFRTELSAAPENSALVEEKIRSISITVASRNAQL